MVKDPGIAKQISQTMQHMWAELDCCIDNVREQCSAEEFKPSSKPQETSAAEFFST